MVQVVGILLIVSALIVLSIYAITYLLWALYIAVRDPDTPITDKVLYGAVLALFIGLMIVLIGGV